MLLDHSHPECIGRWMLKRAEGGKFAVSCAACGASYPRTAWAEDAGEREHELGRLLAYLEVCGRAILDGRKSGQGPTSRWTKLQREI